MSAYYDLFEKPDVRQTGEQQPLYTRLVPRRTTEREEFISRAHLFTEISRSLLEGAMTDSMDELRDCLVNGQTAELDELGYLTPSLNYRREAMGKKELRSASVTLRGLNFRLGKGFYNELDEKIHLKRSPQSTAASAMALPPEEHLRLLEAYLREYPSITHAQYARLAGCSVKQAVIDLNGLIGIGMLMRYGTGRNVTYAKVLSKPQSYIIKVGFPSGACFLFRATLTIVSVGGET